MVANNDHERRRFSRIPFDAQAHINNKQGELHLNCAVIDISLKGLLVEKPTNWAGQLGMYYDVDLILDNARLVIKMNNTVAHVDNEHIGFQCQQLNIESMMHLKRLVSLNLGDESLLERELTALISH